jgi:hypothetical protein
MRRSDGYGNAMPDLQGDIAGQVLLAVRILSGTLAAVFAFAGVLVFSMQGRAWPWFSCLPARSGSGLDAVRAIRQVGGGCRRAGLSVDRRRGGIRFRNDFFGHLVRLGGILGEGGVYCPVCPICPR